MKIMKYILVVVMVMGLAVVGVGIYDIKKNNSQFIANFADTVMRPIIGNTATIKLETVAFNAQDKVNQIVARQQGQDSVTAPMTSNLEWNTVATDKNQEPLVVTSQYYPDAARPYAAVKLVKMNMKLLTLGAAVGTKEPASEVGRPGSGVIPSQIVAERRLVAAFNGGFQYRDGQYGMAVNGQTYLPLQKGLATLTVDTTGKVAIVEDDGQIKPADYRVARQNGEMLIKNGLVIPSSTDKLAKVWGRSVTSNMYTWRSGVGIDSKGNLVYAVGPSLIPLTLAESLKAAGCNQAMQLDINPFWVRYSLFESKNGTYLHRSLFGKMYDGAKEFLTGDKKDFFYVYLRDNKTQPVYKISMS